MLELAKREFAIERIDVRYRRFGRFSKNKTPIYLGSLLAVATTPDAKSLISLERVVRRERQTPDMTQTDMFVGCVA